MGFALGNWFRLIWNGSPMRQFHLFINFLFFIKATISGQSKIGFKQHPLIWQPERVRMLHWNLLIVFDSETSDIGKELTVSQTRGSLAFKGHALDSYRYKQHLPGKECIWLENCLKSMIRLMDLWKHEWIRSFHWICSKYNSIIDIIYSVLSLELNWY